MPSRPAARLFSPKQQREGGGFVVRKAIGGHALPHVDPFVMLDHMGPVDYKPGEALGAPDHPHRGFETVTYLDGSIEHKDSAGNHGILGPGWVQWMTAGRGVVHSEMPDKSAKEKGGRAEGFQLWVNLPSSMKMIEPRYQDTPSEKLPIVTTADGKVTVKIIAGEALGASSPIETKTKILYLDVRLQPGAVYEHPLPSSYQGFAYCWRGAGMVGSADLAIEMGQLALLSESTHGDSFRMKAGDQECRLLLICGEPIGEPIVHYGPFVMNTQEEIQQAIMDYQAGVLGSIPGATERRRETEEAKSKQKQTGTWSEM